MILAKAEPSQAYTILGVNGNDNVVVTDYDSDDVIAEVDQQLGDELEVWGERESDNFYFVYSQRLEIGYWVHPNLIEFKD
jgi:hypothetical protein